MGILTFLSGKNKKKKEDSYSAPVPTPRELIESFREIPSIPSKSGDPSSAKVNIIYDGPLLTSEIRNYKVKGTNPETGKRKTETMLIGCWEDKDKVIPQRTYLLPPYELSGFTTLPTDAQLEVFRRNGVPIRTGMSRRDASAVIGHIIGDDSYRDPLRGRATEYAPITPYPDTLPRSFLQLAVDNQIELSVYYTEEEARNLLKMNLPRCFVKQINSL